MSLDPLIDRLVDEASDGLSDEITDEITDEIIDEITDECFTRVTQKAQTFSPPLELTSEIIDRVLEMAWEDRTPFEAIELQFGLREPQVIALMRREMKASSFRMWRKRVTGRKTKHLKSQNFDRGRFRSANQKGS
jgi:uncharacterized protein (TIGR03643 family)